jgi:spore coat protein JB
MDSNFQEMILQIQQIGFTLVDLNLYLDTHPMDMVALMNYNTLQKQYHELMMAYNAQYGPLMNFGHAPGGMNQFLWVNSPWPWQKDANMAFYRG